MINLVILSVIYFALSLAVYKEAASRESYVDVDFQAIAIETATGKTANKFDNRSISDSIEMEIRKKISLPSDSCSNMKFVNVSVLVDYSDVKIEFCILTIVSMWRDSVVNRLKTYDNMGPFYENVCASKVISDELIRTTVIKNLDKACLIAEGSLKSVADK